MKVILYKMEYDGLGCQVFKFRIFSYKSDLTINNSFIYFLTKK